MAKIKLNKEYVRQKVPEGYLRIRCVIVQHRRPDKTISSIKLTASNAASSDYMLWTSNENDRNNSVTMSTGTFRTDGPVPEKVDSP